MPFSEQQIHTCSYDIYIFTACSESHTYVYSYYIFIYLPHPHSCQLISLFCKRALQKRRSITAVHALLSCHSCNSKYIHAVMIYIYSPNPQSRIHMYIIILYMNLPHPQSRRQARQERWGAGVEYHFQEI